MRSRFLVPAVALLLLCACSKGRVRQEEVVIGNETYNVVMPVGKEVIHPVHGKETWFAVGAMTGEGKINANGVAQVHVFADKTSTATVNLNIQPAPAGSRYVAWVRKPSGGTERIRLDELLNVLKDVRHVITVEVDKDLSAYTEVIVTQEKKSGASDSDPIVAKGALKAQSR
jgi:hypothetical protein